MPRWLLAVFVLQLLWNMAGFPVVEPRHERAQADEAMVMTGWADAQQNPTPRGPGTAANGLLDELPDLPDTLMRRATPRASAAPAPAHRGWVRAGALAPPPAALFRPPPRA